MTTLLENPTAGELRPAPSSTSRLPGRDRDIDGLRELLASRPTATLSVDCFDTVLWRAVPKPTDVFLLLGRRLQDLGLLRSKTTPELFTKMRVGAEQAARLHAFKEDETYEVKLADIYQVVGWQRYTRATSQELARHELMVETSVTTADPWMGELLDEVVAQGDRQLLIVSDSYLDTDALRFLLRSAGLDHLAGVPLFVSCEHGKSKAEGLLELALEELGVDPAECIHVGNSVDSDVRPAVAIGASTVHLPEILPVAQWAIGREEWLGQPAEPSELVDPVAGDSGLTAVRGRIIRRRPDTVPEDDAVFWDLGATTMGPVFTGFAEWVHERCGELGIETALCLMREGRFLAQMLDGVPAARRTCTPVPFWASREACIRASFMKANKAELSRILWRADTPTPQAILATLGLKLSDVPEGERQLARLAQVDNPADVAKAFLAYLGSRPEVRERIVERSAARRKAYIQYLLQSVSGTGRTVALVDLGFGATIQELLHTMVMAEGVELDFRGLYLFTSHRAVFRQLNGHLVEGFLADAGTREATIKSLERSPELLEVTTTSSEGTLLEIAKDGRPVLADRGPEVDQDRQRALVQQGMRAFQREWNFFHQTSSLGVSRNLGTQPRVLHHILQRLVAKPGPEIAKAFAEWNHEANCGSERLDPLVPESVRRCAGYLSPEHLALSKTGDLYWVGAAAAWCGIEDEVSLLQDGRVPLGRFLRTDSGGRLLLGFALPDGQEGVGAEMPLLWYKTGDGAIAWSGVTNARDVVLRTSGTSAILRIDQVTVSRADGTVETLDWRGETRATPEGVTVIADVPVSDGVALVSGTQGLMLSLTSKPSVPVIGVEILYGALRA